MAGRFYGDIEIKATSTNLGTAIVGNIKFFLFSAGFCKGYSVNRIPDLLLPFFLQRQKNYLTIRLTNVPVTWNNLQGYST